MQMKLRLSFIALAALVALLGYGFAWNAALPEDATGPAADEQAIMKAGAAYAAAFDRGDVDHLLSFWSPEAEYIDESGNVTKGREAIAAHIRKSQEDLKGYKMKLERTSFRFVTPDVALVDGKATLVSPEGKEDVTPFASVWVKSNGKWLVRSLRDLAEDDSKEAVTPADHLKPLEPLLGDWVSADKSMDVRLHCGWTLHKSFMLAEYTVKSGDHESMTANRFGWDPVNQQIHSWYFDSVGGFGEGNWSESDDGWVAQVSAVLPDGRIGTATQSIHLIGDKSFVFRIRNRAVDGRPLADVDMHFVRKAGKE
jgi:uncharacterized protein (TIGR02246 family)